MSRFVPEYRVAQSMTAPRPRLGVVAWLLLALGFIVAGVGVLAIIGGLLGFGFSPVAGAPTPLFGLLLLAVAAGVAAAARRGRGHAVLVYVEQAVRLNLPLPAMLAAAERAERGRTRLALRDVRHRLEEGAPLGTAVASALPALPQRTVDLIASAERVGRLPDVLRRLTRPSRAEGVAGTEYLGAAFLRWYPLVTMLVLGFVMAMALVFVMPKVEEIHNDFGIPLPALTQWMVWSGQTFAFPLAAVLALVALGMLGHTVGSVFAPGWAAVNPVRRLTDGVAWHVPPFRGVARARATGDACHVIADALESGRPLDWSIDEAARVQTNVVLERRLGAWAERVRHGEPAPDAAAAAGMPGLLAGMLRTGAAGGVAPDMLRFLARYYDSRFSRAAALTRAALIPATAILTGIPVAAFVLSFFLPLIALIDHLNKIIWSV